MKAEMASFYPAFCSLLGASKESVLLAKKKKVPFIFKLGIFVHFEK
jgi:hypothetical protein